MRITGGAVAAKLGIDFRAARLCVLVRLQHQHHPLRAVGAVQLAGEGQHIGHHHVGDGRVERRQPRCLGNQRGVEVVLHDGRADNGQLDVVALAHVPHGERGEGVKLHEGRIAQRNEQRGKDQKCQQGERFSDGGFQGCAS